MSEDTNDRKQLATVDQSLKELQERRQRILQRMRGREERAYATVVTIRELIDALNDAPPDLPVVTSAGHPVNWLHLYRMRPRDIAMAASPTEAKISTVAEVIQTLERAIGTVMEAHSGYEYRVNPDAKVWIAEYDQPGEGITRVRALKSRVVLHTRKVDQ